MRHYINKETHKILNQHFTRHVGPSGKLKTQHSLHVAWQQNTSHYVPIVVLSSKVSLFICSSRRRFVQPDEKEWRDLTASLNGSRAIRAAAAARQGGITYRKYIIHYETRPFRLINTHTSIPVLLMIPQSQTKTNKVCSYTQKHTENSFSCTHEDNIRAATNYCHYWLGW